MSERVVTVTKVGTWLYDGQVERPLRILRQTWDHYHEAGYDPGPPDLNAEGHAYYVVYGAPTPPAPDDPDRQESWPSRSRTCLSLEKAVALAEATVGPGIDWGRLPEIEDLEARIHALQSTVAPHSAGELLDRWTHFVAGCETGYRFCLAEFDNELRVRDTIARLEANAALGRAAGLRWFFDGVAAVDQRFQALLQADVHRRDEHAPWWRRGILRYAGEDYAADIEGLYGIEVAVRAP